MNRLDQLLNPDDTCPQQLARYYASLGWSNKVIACKMGVTAAEIEKLFEPPKSTSVKQFPSSFENDYKSGLTHRELGEKYNSTRSAVSNYIKQMGWTRPPVLKNKRLIPIPAKLADDFAAGTLVEELAKKYQAGVCTVWSWIKELGLKRKPTRPYKYEVPSAQELTHLVDSGLSIKELTEKYGVSRKTIDNWMKRRGLT